MASGFDFHWFDRAGNGPFGLHFDDLDSLIAFAESGVGMTLSGDPITDVTQYATDSETGQPVTASDLPGAQLPTDPDADPLAAPPVTTAPTAPDVSTQAPTAAGTPPQSVVTPSGGPDPSGATDGSPAQLSASASSDSSGQVAGGAVTDASVAPLTSDQAAGGDGSSADVAPLPANVDAPAPASDAPADSSSTTGQTDPSSTDQAAPDAAPADAQADDQADLERNSEDGPETGATAPGIGAPVDGTDPAVSTGADEPQAPAGDDVTAFPADATDASPLYSETADSTGVTPTAPSS